MPKIKWSSFPNAGDLQTGDIIVGLRGGTNVRLNPVTPEDVQVSLFNYSLATGANDAFVATLNPPVTSLTDGLLVTLSTGALTNNTGTPTLQVDALPAKTITYNNLQLLPGDLETNNTYVLVYNSNTDTFNLINPSVSAANTELVQFNEYNAAIDSGVADAYIADLTPPIDSLTGFLTILCKITNANTGASTLTVNGNTAPIVTANNQPLVGGELIANQVALFIYNTTLAKFVLVNPMYLSVSMGGTGVTSTTAYAVVCGGTTSTGAYQSIASVGTAGQVLTSNGAGALPSFQTPASSGLNFSTQSVVTGSRALNTTYQNTSGKTMCVIVSVSNGGGGVGTTIAYIDSSNPPTGTTVASMNNNPSTQGGTSAFTFMVPNNYYYYVGSNASPLSQWTEWTG